MISNERPSPYGYRPPMHPRPPVQENTLKYGQLDIEHASFLFLLMENPRGRFIRITERSRDAFGCLIVPDTGLAAFQQMLAKMFEAAKQRLTATPVEEKPAAKIEQVQVERKNFAFVLEQDMRGQFLRIIEKAGNFVNEVIVLASGLEAFKNLVDEMIKAAGELPPPVQATPELQPYAPSLEETIKAGLMQLERKSFTFQLKKNPRGRFLRIIEERDGRFNSLMIPAEGLTEFKKWVMDMAQTSEKLDPAANPAEIPAEKPTLVVEKPLPVEEKPVKAAKKAVKATKKTAVAPEAPAEAPAEAAAEKPVKAAKKAVKAVKKSKE